MKRSIYFLIAILLLTALGAAFILTDKNGVFRQPMAVLANPETAVLVAAPGRIEPISEEIKLGSELNGKLSAVLVEEGDRIRRGQTIAVLDDSEYRAQLDSAEARLHQKESELRRIVNGARDQERREAWAAVREAEAVLENSRTEMERRWSLHRDGVVAREEADRATREHEVSKARYEAASQRHALIDDEAREEDRARAEAEVLLMKAQIDETKARLGKTAIKSPINGIVLKKHLKAGESAANSPDMPIVTVGDVSVLRVRADIDETDIGKIDIGQKAYVTADAYGGKKFWGKIVKIGQALGKKNIRTDEPSERIDTKVLETLIELDENYSLPSGLRVDAFVIVNK